jgi:heme/copper-type cytochrome/quinol oxidase subunit 2
MEEKEIHDELAAIRGLMERSSKFISLSGLSGILAGVYALIGAGAAYLIIQNNPITNSPHEINFQALDNAVNILRGLIIVAIAVLIVSFTTAITLSRRKAKRKNQSVWSTTSRALLFHTFIPLLTGGLLSILFLYQGNVGLIVPTMLIFYGLSLVSASYFYRC